MLFTLRADRGTAGLQPRSLTGHRGAFQKRLGEPVVVVARGEDHRAAVHRLAQLLEEGAGALQGVRQRHFAHLDHVAQQDQPVGVAYLLEKCAADLRVARDVLAEGAAQVEVGDDRGSDAVNLAAPWRGGGGADWPDSQSWLTSSR